MDNKIHELSTSTQTSTIIQLTNSSRLSPNCKFSRPKSFFKYSNLQPRWRKMQCLQNSKVVLKYNDELVFFLDFKMTTISFKCSNLKFQNYLVQILKTIVRSSYNNLTLYNRQRFNLISFKLLIKLFEMKSDKLPN